jgi:hypothetical protein
MQAVRAVVRQIEERMNSILSSLAGNSHLRAGQTSRQMYLQKFNLEILSSFTII